MMSRVCFDTNCKLRLSDYPSHYAELLASTHFLMPDRIPLNANFELSDINQEAKIKELHEK